MVGHILQFIYLCLHSSSVSIFDYWILQNSNWENSDLSLSSVSNGCSHFVVYLTLCHHSLQVYQKRKYWEDLVSKCRNSDKSLLWVLPGWSHFAVNLVFFFNSSSVSIFDYWLLQDIKWENNDYSFSPLLNRVLTLYIVSYPMSSLSSSVQILEYWEDLVSKCRDSDRSLSLANAWLVTFCSLSIYVFISSSVSIFDVTRY